MKKVFILSALLALCISLNAQTNHPRLLLTPQGVKNIKSMLGKVPLMDKTYATAKQVADNALAAPMDVPLPVNSAGGYSHEKHKTNYADMYNAAVVYQVSGEKKYAEFVRKMLLKYADMYPTLPVHPASYSRTPGKLFYQVLNEAVWLNFTANAYDCVYDYIPAAERKHIENDLFRPLVDFMENGVPGNFRAFNLMHNFGTWMQSGVAMIGYVIDEPEFVQKALYGSAKDGSVGGFLRQLDVMFSPDGYYDEGVGYQRYAIHPFVTLAECINNNQPELKIFEYRNGIIDKAVNTLLQCTYNGDVFLLNDALDKNIHTYEILFSTSIAYKSQPQNKGMLGMIQSQGIATMTDGGALAAKAIGAGQAKPFGFASEIINIGPKGDQGALSVLRRPENHTCVAMKATTQGGGHGHFDRLSLTLYANESCILPDYGSSRFINVPVKSKGSYTPENKTFAKMSIAHNTVTVDGKCHYDGNATEADKQGCKQNFSDLSDPDFQISCSSEDNAYPGVGMRRTIALITDPSMDFPIVLDLFKLTSDKEHVYDLPYYYNGHFMSANFGYRRAATPVPMGVENGYQHIWQEALCDPKGGTMQVWWLKDTRFYTISTATSGESDAFLIRTGANDPEYNLVTRDGVMFRSLPAKDFTFATVIEPHGSMNMVTEATTHTTSLIERVELLLDNDDYTVVRVRPLEGKPFSVAVVNNDAIAAKNHSVSTGGAVYEWTGSSHKFNGK